MENLEHKNDIEIVDLDPPDGRLRRSFHQAILKLVQKRTFPVRLPPIFAFLLCVVGLLVMPLLIRADVPPISTSARQNPSLASFGSFFFVGRSVVDVAADGKVAYINSNDGTISARRASDGAVLWQHRAPTSTGGPLIVADGQLYFSFLSSSSFGTVEANRASDDGFLWFSQLPPFAGSSPLLAQDGVVYVNTLADNGTVYALRANDGKILWHFSHKNPSLMDTFLSVADGIAAIRTPDSVVHVLRASDGSEILHYEGLSDDWAPSIEGRTIYFLTAQHSLQARHLTDGSLLWQSPLDYLGLRSLSVQDGVIYLSTTGGVIKALKGEDGSLLWQRPMGELFAGPYIQGTSVLYFTLDKTVVSLRATDGSLLWQRTIAMPSLKFNLMAVDGVFFLNENEHSISVWRSSDATLLWHYTTSVPILWEPLLVSGEVYLRQFDGSMVVLRMSDGKVLWQYVATE